LNSTLALWLRLMRASAGIAWMASASMMAAISWGFMAIKLQPFSQFDCLIVFQKGDLFCA
jgi:hypothetical protein